MTITLNGTTGVITPAISGDGSALTNLTSANLTGALPAIDGSALTGVGSSTTYGAVGTYVLGRRQTSVFNQVEFLPASTYAGSSLYPAGISATTSNTQGTYNTTQIYNGDINSRATALSGTWRAMGEVNHDDTFNPMTLFVRIL